MEPKFQTSFIPKSPILTTPSISSSSFSKSRPISFVPLVGTLLFVFSLVASGALFGYEKYLNTQITDASKALVLAKASFDPQTMNALIVSSDRIKSVQGLLHNHTAVSELFLALQKNILPKVSLSSFSFAVDQSTGVVKFSVAGFAESYAVAAEQSKIFVHMPFVTKQNFAGLTLTDKGSVEIKMDGVVDRSLVSYEHVLKNSQTQTQP